MQKGLTIVYTGQGKGKTTASLGLAIRSRARNNKVLFLQFIKGPWLSSEIKVLKKLGVIVKIFGQGFVGILGDKKPKQGHKKSAQKALDFVRRAFESNKFDLIVLDEILIAQKLGLISESDILKLIRTKPKKLNLVLTGRGATSKIKSAADLVTEMKAIKHPYFKGIKARKGLDY
jgi:cob(I)alamin adenosyltransferase